ncbi:MAG TPA: GDSL-type esterase/lipase family protein [Desulfitobacteriaceae bacterium]|nr:GDSL-type esterase/lipase family protein [Desulfitobacteriaceae bacterium]
MNNYRLEIRIILAALLLSLLVTAFLYFKVNNWTLSSQAAQVAESAVQNETAAAGTSANEAVAAEITAEDPAAAPETAPPQVVNPKIVALGDSQTYGYPPGPDYSWTKRLEYLLNVPVVNKGRVGQTSYDLLQRFESDVVAESPGRVIIFAGTGDAIRSISLQEFQENIQFLVGKARSNNITPVLALPLYYPKGQTMIRNMREWEQSYAQTEGIVLLDFASVLYNANGRFLYGLSADGTNPSVRGYEVMGDYAATVLK